MSPVCWFCGKEIEDARIEAEGHLVPRKTSNGGPLWLVPCPRCETENGAERNAAGEFLLLPSVDPGISGWVAALFDGPRTALRARARVWWRENDERRRRFHAARSTPRRPSTRDRPAREEPAREEPAEGPPPAEEPPPAPPPSDVASLLDHYRTLGLPLTATADDLATAFRSLSRKCHPDKVAHLDEEFQQLAERKFRRLRRAYELLGGT